MKKAIVLLLALAVLGGAAFAQVTTGVYLHGEVTVVDEAGNSVFTTNAATITFKASNDKASFSMTSLDPIANGVIAPSNWTATYTVADGVKVSVGKLSNATYRMANVYNNATSRISGYGVLTQITAIEGLNLGVNLPFGTTEAATLDVLQAADIGAAYTIADMGKVIVLANLDIPTDTNKINFGFTYSGTENLTAIVTYVGTFAAAASHAFDVGVDYLLLDGALDVGVEFDGTYDTAFAWTVYPYAAYTVTDNVSVAFDGMYASDATYDFSATAKYDFLNGFAPKFTAGYTGAFYCNLGLIYEVSF